MKGRSDRFVAVCFAAVVGCMMTAIALAGPQITETDRLNGQVLLLQQEASDLRDLLTKCQVDAINTARPAERAALKTAADSYRAGIRTKLGVKTDEEVDWSTLTKKTAPAPEAKP